MLNEEIILLQMLLAEGNCALADAHHLLRTLEFRILNAPLRQPPPQPKKKECFFVGRD